MCVRTPCGEVCTVRCGEGHVRCVVVVVYIRGYGLWFIPMRHTCTSNVP